MNAPTKKLVSLKNGICFSQLCEGLDCDAPSCPDRVTSFAEHCFGKVVRYERWSHRDVPCKQLVSPTINMWRRNDQLLLGLQGCLNQMRSNNIR